MLIRAIRPAGNPNRVFAIDPTWCRPLLWAIALSLLALFPFATVLDGGDLLGSTTICVAALWIFIAAVIYVRPKATRLERILVAVSPLFAPIAGVILKGMIT